MDAAVVNFVLNLIAYNVEILVLKFISFCTKRSDSSILTNNVEVLYVSNNFLVVNKPFDLLINSNDPTLQNTLQMQLRGLLPHLVNHNLPHNFHFVHRLDYATSGVICLGLQKKASSAATSAFEKRETKKYYLALLRGHLYRPVVIDVPVGEDASEQHGSRRMCASTDANCIRPRSAHTRLVILQRGTYHRSPATKVLLRPISGRRHQLRVHCAAIGHTVVGDFTYSNRTDIEPYRMFLHAYRLVLPNHIEPLDVRTLDPFTSQRGAPGWQPTELVNNLDDTVFQKLDMVP